MNDVYTDSRFISFLQNIGESTGRAQKSSNILWTFPLMFVVSCPFSLNIYSYKLCALLVVITQNTCVQPLHTGNNNLSRLHMVYKRHFIPFCWYIFNEVKREKYAKNLIKIHRLLPPIPQHISSGCNTETVNVCYLCCVHSYILQILPELFSHFH